MQFNKSPQMSAMTDVVDIAGVKLEVIEYIIHIIFHINDEQIVLQDC